MSTKFESLVRQDIVGIDALFLFGPPPLIEGEDPGQYADLWEQIARAFQPKDFIEKILVRDITDRTWEIFRLRRLKTKYLEMQSQTALAKCLSESMRGGHRGAKKLINARAKDGDKAMERIEGVLAKRSLTIDGVSAKVIVNEVEVFERIEHQLAKLEASRNAALREIPRHRGAIAALKRLTQQFEEAEYSIDLPDSSNGKEVGHGE